MSKSKVLMVIHDLRIAYILSASAFLVSACSTVDYTEPVGGDTSNVRFATTTAGRTIVMSFEDKACNGGKSIFQLQTDPHPNSPERNLGIPFNNYKNTAAKEVRVHANKMQTYMFESYDLTVNGVSFLNNTAIYDTDYYPCMIFFSHEFETGKQYELKYTMPKTFQCSVQISEIYTDQESHQPKARVLKTIKNDTREVSQSCQKVIIKRWGERRLQTIISGESG